MHFIRIPAGKAPFQTRKTWEFLANNSVNVVEFTVFGYPSAYMISPSEFVKYQQWKQKFGQQHPDIKPRSLREGKIWLKTDNDKHGPKRGHISRHPKLAAKYGIEFVSKGELKKQRREKYGKQKMVINDGGNDGID